MRKTIFVLLAAATLATAQTAPDANLLIYPPPAQSFSKVKDFLALSDTQLEQLREILSEKDRGAQEIYRQIRDKQVELNNLLESGTRDAARIGTLNLEIYDLNRRAGAPDNSFRQRALAILTPDQRSKLADLDQILKLSEAAHQAVGLLLLEPPPPGPPVILATPARERASAR